MYSFSRRLDHLPAREDAERHQEGGEDHEQHGDAVDAHAVAHEAAGPVRLLDELEAGIRRIEIPPDQQRDEERQRRHAERDVQDVPPDCRPLAADEQKKMIAAPASGRIGDGRRGWASSSTGVIPRTSSR